MDDYLANVREIERRIQHIEQYNASNTARALPAAPLGVPDNYDAHVKLMADLQVLAFQSGVTRVSTFKLSRDVNMRVFPESGVTTPFHSCSHHGELPSHIAEFARLNKYHASLVAYFTDKLKNTPDGDGNLLDHSLVLYGSPMGDSNVHNHKRIPVLLMGHASGAVRGNNHVRVADGTPFANVLLTMMNKLGMNMKGIADSTGMINI
jgi:diadenosine tetraphosphatase ApaH/serine/threonine PP2A family protein phosphatase